MNHPAREEIFRILHEVKDPEIPVIDCVELGIVRDVKFESSRIVVDITPTYSGCPAMREIENEISRVLNSYGFQDVLVRTIYAPPWTTDWISEEGREKLKNYGISPPGKAEESLVTITSSKRSKVPCPFCESLKTELKSEFGSTACKAFYYCSSCSQAFEKFKEF